MANLSQNEKAEASAISSESSSEEVTKVDKLLSDEHDPDAGKSDEERAAIVRPSLSPIGTKLTSPTGKEVDAQGRPLAYPMAMLVVSTLLP
jgi:hypothetical protein